MPGQQQGGAVADLQVLRGNGHALADDILHLGPQALAIQGHAIAQDVHHILAEDTGGEQVQGKLAQLVDHGVSGIAASLVTHHHVVFTGEEVYHPALALVTPVDAHDCS